MIEANGFILPIELHGPVFNSVAFHVCPNGPEGDTTCTVSVDIPSPAPLEIDDDGYVKLEHSMTVDVSLHDKADGGHREVMSLSIEAAGEVALPSTFEMSRDALTRTLRVNATSLFYSSIRSYVENLGAMSSMGRFTLPTIDPVKLVATVDGAGEE